MDRATQGTRDIILRTPEWERALAFYGEELGLPLISHAGTIVGFDAGGFVLYVERGEAHGPVHELIFDDVAAARRRLLDAGCTVVEEDAAVPRCYVRDPFGFVFNLGPRRRDDDMPED